MEMLHVTFSVVVSEKEYGYSEPRGDAEIKVLLTRNLVETLEASSLLNNILPAAIADFDKNRKDTKG